MKKLLIVGSGPAGLSAAINAASEGLEVQVLDKADALGGQFRESNAIENYPGFTLPVTGAILSSAMISQAKRFGVDFCCPVTAAGLTEQADGKVRITSDDWRNFDADAVVLALGLQWRRLDAPGVAELMGRGVTYGAPSFTHPTLGDVAIVGGGNSAGQEAVKLASSKAERKVHMIVRKSLDAQMSAYLIQQIDALPNITVWEGEEVASANAGGNGHLKSITLSGGKGGGALAGTELTVDALMIYIGATPHTFWLKGTGLDLDPYGFIRTGVDAPGFFDVGDQFATNLPGVFAVGDARLGSCKRIAAAVGEGSTVMPFVHKFLATKETKDA